MMSLTIVMAQNKKISKDIKYRENKKGTLTQVNGCLNMSQKEEK